MPGSEKSESPPLIVALGGSAGAIAALQAFFRAVPPDSGMAYVVITHLPPDHESRLAEVLQRSTPMSVQQIVADERVVAERVYVIPPGKSLSMSGDILVASDFKSLTERRTPVDMFFRALADDHRERAVVVVLSGAGTDGSSGLRRIKENRGFVVAQDPTEAGFPEMPRHAIATGVVDHVLPASEMAGKILVYRDHLRAAERSAKHRQTTEELQAFVDASPLPIITLDLDANVSAWNNAAELMFGWTAAETIGRPLLNLPSGQSVTIDDVVRQAGRPIESARRRRDGTLIDVVVWPLVLRHPDGTVRAVGGMIENVTERKRLAREREVLLRRIVEAQEDERQRIARELHDEMGQHLTALKIGLEALPDSSSESVKRLRDIVTQIDSSVDRLTLELRPHALDDVGLDGAIAHLISYFAAATGITADLQNSRAPRTRLPEAIETTLYRALQEALTNISKHAAATTVSIILDERPSFVQLTVEDNGCGFELADPFVIEEGRRKFGLIGLRERLAHIGGSVQIESTPGGGTSFFVRVPLEGK